jgi:hypothetical protein
LILDLSTITHLFAEIANRLEYRLAAKASSPISDRVYDTPCACAIAIATKLNNVLPTMQLGEYATAPFTFALFTPVKKESATDNKRKETPNGGRSDKHDSAKKPKMAGVTGTGGLLAFSGTGKLPTSEVLQAHPKSGKFTRLCLNFLIKGRSCKWGDDCSFVHLKRTEDLTLENQKTIKSEVKNHAKLSWVTSNANGTTSI